LFGDGFGYELREIPHTVRVPDVSFVRADRLPPGGFGGELFKGAPDLAIEVLSPSETVSRLDEKLADYAAARTPLTWIDDVERRTVAVIAASQPGRWLGENDTLTADRVIPDFSCAVADLFEGVARESARRD
jgi:Uma2 family endonuclease